MPNWTKEEDEILRQMFQPGIHNAEIEKAIPRRTRMAIWARAQYIGLKRPSQKEITWTEEEDRILLEKYKEINVWADLLDILPGKDVGAIKRRARKFGIKKHNPRAGRANGQWCNKDPFMNIRKDIRNLVTAKTEKQRDELYKGQRYDGQGRARTNE